MVEIIPLGETNMEKLVSRVAAGQVFIYPTDTVYGIGCDALNEKAVKRIFDIKGRQKGKPLLVAFSDIEMLLRYVDIDEKTKRMMSEKLPGPFAFIVKNRRIPSIVTAGNDTVGVRIPDYGPIRQLIKKLKRPIITTSANTSGESPANSLHEISREVLSKVDFAIDAGRFGSGKPSSIIDMSTGEVLR